MPFDLQDCKNGTYKAVVRMDKTGLASIHAQINGQPLGLPATLHVLPAELHSLLMVTAPAIETTAGGHLNFRSSSLQKDNVWQPLGLPATLHVLPAELHSLLLVTPPAIETTAGRHLHSGSSSLHKGTVCSSIYAHMIGRALRVPSTLHVLPAELHSPRLSLHSLSTPQQAGVLVCI